ncbi:MAG: hypothetical protein MHM6MM_000237 [Cercozoa sp. M6MM]
MGNEGWQTLRVAVQSDVDRAVKRGFLHYFAFRAEAAPEHYGMDPSRTLKVANVTAAQTHAHVAAVFSSFGSVAQCALFEDRSSGRCAYVEFEENKAFKALCKFNDKHVLPQPSLPAPLIMPQGLAKYDKMYEMQRPNPRNLANQVNAFMERFDAAERKRREAESAEPEVDEDGWFVVRHRSKRPLSQYRKLQTKADVPAEKRAKIIVGDNFYGFHAKKQREQEVETLREQFRADREKARQMRQRRRALGQ